MPIPFCVSNTTASRIPLVSCSHVCSGTSGTFLWVGPFWSRTYFWLVIAGLVVFCFVFFICHATHPIVQKAVNFWFQSFHHLKFLNLGLLHSEFVLPVGSKALRKEILSKQECRNLDTEGSLTVMW